MFQLMAEAGITLRNKPADRLMQSIAGRFNLYIRKLRNHPARELLLKPRRPAVSYGRTQNRAPHHIFFGLSAMTFGATFAAFRAACAAGDGAFGLTAIFMP